MLLKPIIYMYQIETIYITFVEDHLRIISVKIGKNTSSSLRMSFKEIVDTVDNYGRRTTDSLPSQNLALSTLSSGEIKQIQSNKNYITSENDSHNI
jgi:hypothetical protein